jgi:hypothetical protein
MSQLSIKDPLHFEMEKWGVISCVDIDTTPMLRLPGNYAAWLMNAYPKEPPQRAAFYFAIHVPTDYDDEKYIDFLQAVGKIWSETFGIG